MTFLQYVVDYSEENIVAVGCAFFNNSQYRQCFRIFREHCCVTDTPVLKFKDQFIISLLYTQNQIHDTTRWHSEEELVVKNLKEGSVGIVVFIVVISFLLAYIQE